VIRDIEGNEHGPVDQETLIKWVEDDRVTAKTEVRNSLLGTWKRIDDLEFLREMLDEQKIHAMAHHDALTNLPNRRRLNQVLVEAMLVLEVQIYFHCLLK
jgi:PleD family two-component response regulator